MRRICGVLLLLCCALGAWGAEYRTFDSQYYVITTDVSAAVAQRMATHLDAVYQTYLANMPPLANQAKLPVYLFSRRQDYQNFAGKLGANPANLSTSGYFWRTKTWQGIIVCLDGRSSLSSTLLTLQHECTHQYIYARYGKRAPVWLSEGLATYFKYGVMGKDGMLIGIVPMYAQEDVYAAIKHGTVIPLSRLLTLSHEEWQALSTTDPKAAHLCYVESWAVVHFLMHGHNGANRDRLFDYLLKTSQGRNTTNVFAEVFQTDYAAFEKEWTDYLLQLMPDLSPTELLDIAKPYLATPPTEPVTTNVTPQAWKDAQRTTTISVRITPAKPPLLPELTATCPRYTLHLTWTLDGDGKPLEQFSYEAQ